MTKETTPTIEEKLSFIREACIKANPEIVEFKFGCELKYMNANAVIYGKMMNKYLIRYTYGGDTWEEGSIWNAWEQGVQKVLGRPIHLADILFAIRINDKPITECWHVDMWGNFQLIHNDIKFARIENKGIKWNLLQDDLTNQSEDTINFLYELLHE